jgi:hypothetical protein
MLSLLSDQPPESCVYKRKGDMVRPSAHSRRVKGEKNGISVP